MDTPVLGQFVKKRTCRQGQLAKKLRNGDLQGIAQLAMRYNPDLSNPEDAKDSLDALDKIRHWADNSCWPDDSIHVVIARRKFGHGKRTGPAFGREAKFPFAWQNGVLNLVEPVSFKSSDQASLEQTACRRAIGGLSLQRQQDKNWGQCALNVVGQFQSQDENAKRVVRRILSESQVELIESGSIDAYIRKIETTGKKIAD